jgi:hypothetical protein
MKRVSTTSIALAPTGGRQKSRLSLWPRQTFSRQKFAVLTETGAAWFDDHLDV